MKKFFAAIIKHIREWYRGDDIDLTKEEPRRPAPPYSTKLVACVVAAAMVAAMPGCQAIRNAEPVVADAAAQTIAAIEEADQWISLVESLVGIFFRTAKVSPDVEAEFNKVDQAVKLALVGLTRTAAAATATSKEDYDAAYLEFKSAYEAFLGVAKSLGVVGSKGTVMLSRGGKSQVVTIPELRLLARKH